MKLAAFLAILATATLAHAAPYRTPIKPKLVTQRKVFKTQLCPGGQCQKPPARTQNDPMDGSDLPEDLFGGTPDGRGGGSSGGNAGNTRFPTK